MGTDVHRLAQIVEGTSVPETSRRDVLIVGRETTPTALVHQPDSRFEKEKGASPESSGPNPGNPHHPFCR